MRLYTSVAIALLAGLATGCVNKQRMTEPARSVGEQLLLSTAIDRALDELDMEAIRRLAASAQQDYELGTLTDAGEYSGCACCDPTLRQQLEETLIRNGAVFNPEHDESAVEEQLALLREAAGCTHGSGAGGKTKRQQGSTSVISLAGVGGGGGVDGLSTAAAAGPFS